jgi:hypothetical protein
MASPPGILQTFNGARVSAREQDGRQAKQRPWIVRIAKSIGFSIDRGKAGGLHGPTRLKDLAGGSDKNVASFNL